MVKSRDKEVAELAYKLYEKSGRAEGRHVEHWLEAEKVLKAKGASGTGKSKRKSPAKATGVKAAGSAKPRKKTGVKAAAKKRADVTA